MDTAAERITTVISAQVAVVTGNGDSPPADALVAKLIVRASVDIIAGQIIECVLAPGYGVA